MKQARFDVSLDYLHQVLHMPPDAVIFDIVVVREYGRATARFLVDDPHLPEAPQPHECVPVMHQERVTWDYNLQ